MKGTKTYLLLILLQFILVYCGTQENNINTSNEVNEILKNGKEAFEKKEYLDAIKWYNEALEYDVSPQVELRVLKSKGLSLCYIRALDECIDVLVRADSLAKEQNNEEAIKEINLNLSSSYLNKGNYLKSFESLKLSQYYSEKLGDSTIWAYTLLNQAMIFSEKGIYDLAADYAYKSLVVLEDLDEIKYESSALDLLGIIYLETHDYQKSDNYHSKCLSKRKEITYAYGIAASYNNLGNLYKEQKDYEHSKIYYDSALLIKDTLAFNDFTATTLANVGEVFFLQGEYDTALVYYRKALQFKKKEHHPKKMTTANCNIAEVLIKQNKYEEALPFIKEANAIADRINSLPELKWTYTLWKDYYKGRDDFEQSLYYSSLSEKIGDSILSIDKNNTVQLLDIEYQTIKRLRAINFHKKKSKVFLVLFFLAIWLAVLIALWHFFRTRKLKEELKTVSKEITRIQQVEDEKSNKDFKDYLITKFGITEKRYRIWELIARGKTTTEIAVLTEVSENTIKTQRRELYSKLNITSSRKNVDAAHKFLLEMYDFLEE